MEEGEGVQKRIYDDLFALLRVVTKVAPLHCDCHWLVVNPT